MMDRSQVALFTAAVALLALAGCDGPVAPTPADDADALAGPNFGRAGADGMVSTPFRARFLTEGEGLVPDPACGEPPRLLNVQVGEGVATRLGRFSVRISFCMDVTDVLDDGVLTEGESVPYDNGVGTLTAANGDELHIAISGAVLPSDHPDFDLEFHDPFQFTGGTGRFAGASGEGATSSFVNQAADRTHHDWRATLRLPRGR